MSGVIAGLLDRCWAVRLSLTVKGDALHVDFDRDHPPTDLIEEIRQYKPEVMAALLSESRRRSSEYETNEKRGSPQICCVCGEALGERLPTFWSGNTCHRVCGERVFEEARARGDYCN